MNRNLARKIAEVITNEQLKEMFNSAKENIKDWTVVSNVNRIMSKGTAWNILAKAFDESKEHHIMAKTNMVREFGEHLPKEFVDPFKNVRPKTTIAVVHQDPIF